MSSRGTNEELDFEQQYETIENIHDAEVLRGLGDAHSLPEVSHSPDAKYIKLNKDGTFRTLRVYDSDCYLTFEIGYHGESSLRNGRRDIPVLHYHYYDRDFNRTTATEIFKGDAYYEEYKKYFRGIKI